MTNIETIKIWFENTMNHEPENRQNTSFIYSFQFWLSVRPAPQTDFMLYVGLYNEKHGESRAVILDLVHKSPSHCDNYQDTEEFCTKGRTAQIWVKFVTAWNAPNGHSNQHIPSVFFKSQWLEASVLQLHSISSVLVITTLELVLKLGWLLPSLVSAETWEGRRCYNGTQWGKKTLAVK